MGGGTGKSLFESGDGIGHGIASRRRAEATRIGNRRDTFLGRLIYSGLDLGKKLPRRPIARFESGASVRVVLGILCLPAQITHKRASTKSACLARRSQLHNSVRPPTQKDRHRTLEDPGSRECGRVEKLASVERLRREPRLLGVVRKVQAEHAAGVVAGVAMRRLYRG
jgi:hypothetical protein